MAKVKVAWKTKEGFIPKQAWRGEGPDLIGYQEIGCHIVFNVKMDFSQKACFVVGGHTTESPVSITYSSVDSHENVCLSLLIAALSGLDIMLGDLQNAYLNMHMCQELLTR